MRKIRHNLTQLVAKVPFFKYPLKIEKISGKIRAPELKNVFNACLPFVKGIFGDKFLFFQKCIITPQKVALETDHPAFEFALFPSGAKYSIKVEQMKDEEPQKVVKDSEEERRIID